MNKLLGYISLTVLMICLISIYLYSEGLVKPIALITFLPIIVGTIYSCTVDSFWKKISSDSFQEEHLFQLVRMLIRHRKDEHTANVILGKITSERMNSTLLRNLSYERVIQKLLEKKKVRDNLFHHIRTICESVREHAVARLKTEVAEVQKLNKPLEDDGYLELFNEKVIKCFLKVGGYPTWQDARDLLLPIFDGFDRNRSELFLIEAERGFKRSLENPAFEYFNVEGAYRQLLLSLRKALLDKEKST